MNESLILETMLEMKSQLGEIHGAVKAVDEKFDRHVSDDAAVAERVRALELAQAKERGARRVWIAIGTGAATFVGFLVSWFTER